MVSVVVLKALGHLLDSLKKFSGLSESCEGASTAVTPHTRTSGL